MPGQGEALRANEIGNEKGLFNLRVANNRTTPDSKVDISCDVAFLSSTDSPPKLMRFRNVSVTVDLTLLASDGVSGLDTGAEADDTLYYYWLLGKSDESTIIGVASINGSAPTAPTGYDYKAFVGCFRNGHSDTNIDPNGIGNLQYLFQTGRQAHFQNQHRVLASTVLGATGWATINLTAIGTGVSRMIPTGFCDVVELSVQLSHDTNGNSLYISGAPSLTDNAGGILVAKVDADSQEAVTRFKMPIDNNLIAYRGGATVADGPTVEIFLAGLELNV